MTILDEAVALAGVDPRELHALLAAGMPERTIALARAFEDAGRDAHEAYEQGRRAHATGADGFGNDGEPVLDAAAQNDRAWRLLGQGGQDMVDTATFLKRSVGALDDAQAASRHTIDRMVADLNAVAARSVQVVAPDPAAAAAARHGFLAEARHRHHRRARRPADDRRLRPGADRLHRRADRPRLRPGGAPDAPAGAHDSPAP